jgi:hypothetical protein
LRRRTHRLVANSPLTSSRYVSGSGTGGVVKFTRPLLENPPDVALRNPAFASLVSVSSKVPREPRAVLYEKSLDPVRKSLNKVVAPFFKVTNKVEPPPPLPLAKSVATKSIPKRIPGPPRNDPRK